MVSSTIGDVRAIIRSGAHRRLRISPTDTRRRFRTPKMCLTAVESGRVQLRGWDFPHIEYQEKHGGSRPFEEGWESWSNYQFPEAWRLFQSGQFIYQAAYHEDHDRWNDARHLSGRPFISLEGSAWEVVELFEWARRLTLAVDFGEFIRIETRMTGMEGRVLVADPRKNLGGVHPFARDTFTKVETYHIAELQENVLGLSVSWSQDLFSGFSFDPPQSILTELHSQLLERRF